MPGFTQQFIDKVIDSSDILGIVSRFTHLSKKGGRYFGLCPFPDHNEKTASFSVSPEKGFYYCFGCGKGGNVISFVMEMNRFTFPEAIEYLAGEANLELEYSSDYKGGKTNYSSKKLIYEINRLAGNFYYKNLLKNKQALSYLTARGITPSAIKTFGLGFSPFSNELSAYLFKAGYKKDDIIAASLARENERGLYDYFRGRIMFPILDVSNNIVGFGGRVMDKSEPKYLNSPENSVFFKGSTLYNLNRAKAHLGNNPVIMVEGYMDVISLYDNGVKCVCATLGTALGENHAKIIKRYTQNVILCYDGDNAGVKAAIRGSSILENAGLSAKVLVLPDNHDPDSYIRAYGKDEFIKRAAEALYAADFKINELRERYDTNDIQQKSQFLTEACEVVSRVNDEVKWEYYAKKLSNLTDTDVSTIKSMIFKLSKEDPNKKNYHTATEEEMISEEIPVSNPNNATELPVLKYIAESYENFAAFIALGGTNLFTGENGELYDEIEKLYKNKKDIDINSNLIYNNKITHSAALLNMTETRIKDAELKVYVKALTVNMYSAQLKSLKKKIDNEETNGTEDKALMLKEYGYIKTKLLELMKSEV